VQRPHTAFILPKSVFAQAVGSVGSLGSGGSFWWWCCSLGTGRTGKDSQACFRFCFIQQFIALCQFVNWSGPPLFPGPQNLYKGRLVGNTQKAAEQQHTDCHKTGSQARLRRSGLKKW